MKNLLGKSQLTYGLQHTLRSHLRPALNITLRPALSIMLIAIAALLSACGASKSGDSTTRGSSVPNPYPPTGGGNINALGECNRVKMNSAGFIGQIGTYYAPQTMQLQKTFLNLNIKTAPADLFSSDSVKFKFYRWTRSTTPRKVLNQVAAKFFFVDKLNGSTTQPTLFDTLSKSTLTNVKSTLGSSWMNVPVEKIFDRVLIVLTGMDMQYDAMTIAHYNTAVSNNAANTFDVLLPAFYANPNTYKQFNPYPELYTLHPNFSMISSNASDTDFMQAIETICYEMSGMGSRVPASTGAPSTLKPRDLDTVSGRQSPELVTGPQGDPSQYDEINSTPRKPSGFWQSFWDVVVGALDAIGGR
jgi:hypothetical protein